MPGYVPMESDYFRWLELEAERADQEARRDEYARVVGWPPSDADADENIIPYLEPINALLQGISAEDAVAAAPDGLG